MRKEQNFWCRECEEDLVLLAEIVTASDKSSAWRARCPKCDGLLLRYITFRKDDPYYRLSRKVKIEREMYKRDLVQPNEAGFRTLYPEQAKKLEAEEEVREKKAKEKKKEADKFFKENKSIHTKEAVKKVLEIESNG